MKEKILLWLIKRVNLSSYAERVLMFKLQSREQADTRWQEVKQIRVNSGCSNYDNYLKQWAEKMEIENKNED